MTNNKQNENNDAGQDRFNIRLPKGTRDEIAKKAEENQRSMNSELVARILKTLEEETPLDDLNIFLSDREINRLGIQEASTEYNIQSLISNSELKMLTFFRKLTPSKKKALLELLR